MSIAFSTKAETLERVNPHLRTARVLPLRYFSVGEWNRDRDAALEDIVRDDWSDRPLIVRSSARAEDSSSESLAGHFDSEMGVRGRPALIAAIERVIGSFGENPSPEDQVLVQPMLEKTDLSGVAFSIDPNVGAPYYVINYDDESGSTDSVTSGQSGDLKTFYCCKHGEEVADKRLRMVVDMLRELEELFGSDAIDIEFGFRDNVAYLFQVRPLVIRNRMTVDLEKHRAALRSIHQRVAELNRPHPYLYGRRTVFGVMPDWNPAEILGARPRPLALSLYKEIITDNIWAYQRDNYGYRNLRSFPLLINFHGLPYIDVRVSFNSFIPAKLDKDISERLADHYIDRLISLPSLHDKVEFEIIYSCYTLDLPERIAELRKHGFSADDLAAIEESLRELTNRIIHGERGLWKTDIDKITKLEERREIILNSEVDEISKIYWLLEDCKRYGTLPFAGLARAGFIAVQLLRSLVNVGVLNDEEYESFMGTLETVGSRLALDFENLSKKAFTEKYGHLRPGTYDILSPRYDEAIDRYFDWSRADQAAGESAHKSDFRLSLDQLKKIESLLASHGLDHDLIGFFDFIKAAIEGREHAKFIFTRSLSDVMNLIKSVAEKNGLSLEETSFLDISIIHEMYASSHDARSVFRESSLQGRENYEFSKSLVLPPLIVHPGEAGQFHIPSTEPNFITMKSCVGNVVFSEGDRAKLAGNILMIPSADPGFDWIFSHGIAGFITMYGGVNSHMAIRSGELGIPAVIGAGEILYNTYAKAEVLSIDCANRQVKILR